MIAPPVAAGQDRSPTPSAEELWRTYPLQQSPEPSETFAPAASTRPADEPPAPEDEAPVPLIGAAVLLLTLAGSLAVVRRRSRQPSLPGPSWITPLLPAMAATAMLPDPRPRSPRLTALGDRPPPGPAGRPAAEIRPPDPRRGWTAELEWRKNRFAVVARADEAEAGVVIARSDPLPWPPADAEAVDDLRRTAELLEGALSAAGWTPLPPGRAWYAKRFAWAADAPRKTPAPALEPVPDSPEAEPAPVGARFKLHAEWPAGTEELWRCEIRWHAGWVSSRFDAAAHEPGHRRGTTVGSSDEYKWLLKGDPEEGASEYTAEVELLADRLVAAGWEPAGMGRRWYAKRFVWRREGAPPDQLDPAQAEAKR